MMSSLQKELWGYPFSEIILFKSLLRWICRSCKRSRVSTSSRTDGEESSNLTLTNLIAGLHSNIFPIKYMVYFGAWFCCKWTQQKRVRRDIFRSGVSTGPCTFGRGAKAEEPGRSNALEIVMGWGFGTSTLCSRVGANDAPAGTLFAHEDLRKTGR